MGYNRRDSEEKARKIAEFSGIPIEACMQILEPDDEHYLVSAIRNYLRTPEQKAWMDANDVTVEDMLNGRIEGEDLDAAAWKIMGQWNQKLGHKVFGDGSPA